MLRSSSNPLDPLRRFRALLQRLAGWPRRIAALVCLAAAILSSIGAASRPDRTPLAPVVVTARAVAAGTVLSDLDLRVLHWPNSNVPATAIGRTGLAAGRRAAVALARGEPVQRGSLLEPAIAAALSRGQVATTVSLADANQATILRSGERVDLYAASDGTVLAEGQPVTGVSRTAVAWNVSVIAVLPVQSGLINNSRQPTGVSLIIATDSATAGRIAQHLSTQFLATLVPSP